MGKRLESISEDLKRFIEDQKIYFVATAAADGTVNLSPKGLDSLRVLSPNRVMWLNVTGSGNETAAHLRQNDRITMMFCAFEGKPVILRLYGHARIYHPRNSEWDEYAALFPVLPGARQLIDVTVDLVQTSCGMAVPLMKFEQERNELNRWAEKQGESGIRTYWQNKNLKSLDGFETRIFDEQQNH
jgi:hypothetical protein